jgi:hypothetical protein
MADMNDGGGACWTHDTRRLNTPPCEEDGMSRGNSTTLMPGTPFGRWTVVRFTRRLQHKDRYWVRCECGVEKETRAQSLLSGTSESCGCMRKERARVACTKHGAATTGRQSPEYTVWMGMKNRCHQPNGGGYALYGARGIAVCERWRKNFVAFLADVGPRPSKHHSLDRIDGSKGYEPGNVRWATQKEQMRNMGRNHIITHNGETLCLVDWSLRSSIHVSTLAYRLRRGWPLDLVFTHPPRLGNRVKPLAA